MSIRDKYEMGEKIGSGGMGEVFRGVRVGSHGFRKPVAIKRLHPHLAGDERFVKMFVNEARVCSTLNHGNIVEVHDFAAENGELLLVMEFIDGVDLAMVRDRGPLPVDVAVAVIRAVAEALDYAHGREIVHLDVTPHNVMISAAGEVKLMDFGLAKAVEISGLNDEETIKGKIGYLSPEQVNRYETDGRSDLFSLGVIFYELLTGEHPFGRGECVTHSIMKMLTAQVRPPSTLQPEISPEIDAVVMKLLDRDPDERCGSARELIDALPAVDCSAERLAAAAAGRLDEPMELPTADTEDAEDAESGPKAAGSADTRRSGKRRRWLSAVVALVLIGIAGVWWSGESRDGSDSAAVDGVNEVEIERPAPIREPTPDVVRHNVTTEVDRADDGEKPAPGPSHRTPPIETERTKKRGKKLRPRIVRTPAEPKVASETIKPDSTPDDRLEGEPEPAPAVPTASEPEKPASTTDKAGGDSVAAAGSKDKSKKEQPDETPWHEVPIGGEIPGEVPIGGPIPGEVPIERRDVP